MQYAKTVGASSYLLRLEQLYNKRTAVVNACVNRKMIGKYEFVFNVHSYLRIYKSSNSACIYVSGGNKDERYERILTEQRESLRSRNTMRDAHICMISSASNIHRGRESERPDVRYMESETALGDYLTLYAGDYVVLA